MTVEFSHFDSTQQLDEQRELFRNSFPETEGSHTETVDHYNWKFHSFPATPASYEFMARDEERMLGYYAAIPFPYNLAGRPAVCGMVCDVMTHSSTRRKGVFTKLGAYSVGELSRLNLDFLTGYPVRAEVIPGHLKVGWRISMRLPMYIRPIKTNAVLSLKGFPWLATMANPLLAFYNFAFSNPFRSVPPHRFQILDSKGLAELEDYDSFQRKWSATVKNYLIKSREFLSWRLNAPGTRYYIVVVRDDNDEIAGVVITRSTVLKGIPCLAILDLMLLAEKRSYYVLLHNRLLKLARELGREAITVMMSSNNALLHQLFWHGFIRSPFTFSLITYPISSDLSPEDFTREEDWRIGWIDSDDL